MPEQSQQMQRATAYKLRIGDILACNASVNKVWFSNIEVGVKVVADDFRSLEKKDVLSAYFTFSAINEDSLPYEDIPEIVPEKMEEKRRYAAAESRIRFKKKNIFQMLQNKFSTIEK